MLQESAEKLMKIWRAYIPNTDEAVVSVLAEWIIKQQEPDYPIISKAIESISAEYTDGGKYKNKPTVMTLRKRVKRLKADHNKHQRNGKGCDVCQFTGLVSIVMVRDVTAGKMRPIPPTRTIPAPEAMSCLQPCSCDFGKLQNDCATWRYSDAVLHGLQTFAVRKPRTMKTDDPFTPLTRAWSHAADCMRAWRMGDRDQQGVDRAAKENRFNQIATPFD